MKRTSRFRERSGRTNKKSAKDLFTIVVSFLLVIGLGAMIISLTDFDRDITYPSEKPPVIVPSESDETIYDTDVELGSGMYGSSDGVLTYTYEGDYTLLGYDLGFDPGSVTTVGGNAENSSTWTSVVKYKGNDVLEIGQVSETNGNTPCFPSLKSTGERYVFETDIRWLGSEGGVNPDHDDDDPNWFFRIEYHGNEQSVPNSFYYDMFCMYKLGEDYFYLSNDHEVYDYEIKIKLGTWINLRIEYIPVTDTTGNVLIYINNKLAATEFNFQNKNDNGDAYSNSSFRQVQIENRGKCYDFIMQLDNTYVSAVGEGSSSEDNTGEEEIIETPVLTFDSEEDLNYVNLNSTFAPDGVMSDEPAEEKEVKAELIDGALVLDSPVYYLDSLEIVRTNDVTGTKAVFEADVTIDVGNLGDTEAWIYFIFYQDVGERNTPFYVKINDGGESATITQEGESTGITELIKDNVKFTLRLEYLINDYGYNNTFIYVKPDGADEFISLGRSTINAVPSAPSANDMRFRIETNRFSNVKLTLDNVRFECRD